MVSMNSEDWLENTDTGVKLLLVNRSCSNEGKDILQCVIYVFSSFIWRKGSS
jgi:hypothetical protein